MLGTEPSSLTKASQHLAAEVAMILQRDCYPRLYRRVRRDTGEMAGAVLSWGFHSLLGALCTYRWHGVLSRVNAKLRGATISSAWRSGATSLLAACVVRRGCAIIAVRRENRIIPGPANRSRTATAGRRPRLAEHGSAPQNVLHLLGYLMASPRGRTPSRASAASAL